MSTYLLNFDHRLQLVQLRVELAEGVDVLLVLRPKLLRHAVWHRRMQFGRRSLAVGRSLLSDRD